jgi:hypothetical protein
MKKVLLFMFCVSFSSCFFIKNRKTKNVSSFDLGILVNLYFADGSTESFYRKDTTPIPQRRCYLAYQWAVDCGSFCLVNFKDDVKNLRYSVIFEKTKMDTDLNSWDLVEVKNLDNDCYSWKYPQDMIKIIPSVGFSFLSRHNISDRHVTYLYKCKDKKLEVSMQSN